MAAKRILTVVSLAVLFMVVGGEGSPAASQGGPLLWDFDDGLQGWELSGTPVVLWDADGSPATLPGEDPPTPSAKSPPNSLNYNNGVDYDIGGNGGQALSPEIEINQIENFAFWCTYDTEGEMDDGAPGIDNINNFDVRLVGVFDSDGEVVFVRQLLNPNGENPPTWWDPDFPPPPFWSFEECGQPGTGFHQHFFPLDPAWSPLQVAFEFWTGPGPQPLDPLANDHAGWFLDDIAVTGEVAPPPGGTGGETRENANGDRSGNDAFGENWCGAGSSSSGLLMLGCLLALATVTMLKR